MVPGVSNLREEVAPWSMLPGSNEPSSAVTVCFVGSRLVQTTVLPAVIEMAAGENLKLARSTATVVGPPPPVVCAVAGAAAGVGLGGWSPHAASTRLRQSSNP